MDLPSLLYTHTTMGNTLRENLIDKPYRKVMYKCGHTILLIEKGHRLIDIDLRDGRCGVIEQGSVSDHLIEQICDEGWIFKTGHLLIKSDRKINTPR